MREIQIETTLICYFYPMRSAIIYKYDNILLTGLWGNALSYIAGGDVNSLSILSEIWLNLTKLHMNLPFVPAIPLLGVYPKDTLSKI